MTKRKSFAEPVYALIAKALAAGKPPPTLERIVRITTTTSKARVALSALKRAGRIDWMKGDIGTIRIVEGSAPPSSKRGGGRPAAKAASSRGRRPRAASAEAAVTPAVATGARVVVPVEQIALLRERLEDLGELVEQLLSGRALGEVLRELVERAVVDDGAGHPRRSGPRARRAKAVSSAEVDDAGDDDPEPSSTPQEEPAARFRVVGRGGLTLAELATMDEAMRRMKRPDARKLVRISDDKVLQRKAAAGAPADDDDEHLEGEDSDDDKEVA